MKITYNNSLRSTQDTMFKKYGSLDDYEREEFVNRLTIVGPAKIVVADGFTPTVGYDGPFCGIIELEEGDSFIFNGTEGYTESDVNHDKLIHESDIVGYIQPKVGFPQYVEIIYEPASYLSTEIIKDRELFVDEEEATEFLERVEASTGLTREEEYIIVIAW